MQLFETTDKKSVYIEEGLVILERTKGCEIFTGGTSVMVGADAADVAKAFGHKPKADERAKD